MASSIPRAANKKNGAKKASAALETKPSLKKFKSSDVSFSPQTIETPEGYKQGSASNGRNRVEDLLHKFFRRYEEMGGLEIELETRDDFLERVEPLLSPEFGTSLDGVTEDFSMIKDLGFEIQDLAFKMMVLASVLRRRLLTKEDDFKKTITSLEDIISCQDKRISLLTSDMDLKSAKLAEAEAKLKESELSKEHLSSRVESLEAELNRKLAEIEVLKNKAVASEKKASRVANNIIEIQKYSKALSTAAAKAVEDLKSSEEKSRDSDANLLLYLASSNQA